MGDDNHRSVPFPHQSVDGLLDLIFALGVQSRGSLVEYQYFWLLGDTTSYIIQKLPIAILCFWPPDNLTPLSPTRVFRCSGNRSELYTNSLALAISRALFITYSVFDRFDRPYSIFSLRLPEKRVGSWETKPIYFLSLLVSIYLIFLPLIRI
jgi:hypothetical protein